MAPYDPASIPFEQWASAGALSFLPWTEHNPTPTNDPSTVNLPTPYTVCVLGASRGIGAHIAYAYVRAGCAAVILAARRMSGLQETAAECRRLNPAVQVEIASCDITDAGSVKALAATVGEKFDRLDVCVVNSGVAGEAVPKVTNEDEEGLAMVKMASDVNYVGTFYAAKYLIPLLLKTEKGAKAFIGINTGASLIIRGIVCNPKYCISKVAQMRLLEMLHEQYSGEGLATYALHPGAVQTEMAESAPDAFKASLIDSLDLAGAWCVWLTKDEQQKWLSGRWISGNWKVEDLVAKKEEIVQRDLLKLVMSV